MTEGLSIRPQTLRLAPRYRRLRDAILRPQLRLTESRYFWERWKPRLGPDAAVLIMEVRDRCNQTLARAMNDSPADSIVSDALNSTGEEETLAEGCTVSASDLAAACGFSRVTLWRILQREDVRRFVTVEHNYVYDRRLGKKRRTFSTYHVQMEDPLVEEDEARLQTLLAGQTTEPALEPEPLEAPRTLGAIGAAHATASRWGHERAEPGARAYPRPPLQTETETVDGRRPPLQTETANSGCSEKPQNVPETKLNQRLGANARRSGATATDGPAFTGISNLSGRTDGSGGIRTGSGATGVTGRTGNGGGAADVDIWKRYPELAHHVEEAERLLGDVHSRGFYLKAAKALYPRYMDVWQRALGLAREEQHIRRSRGALFTRLLRTFAAEAGVSL